VHRFRDRDRRWPGRGKVAYTCWATRHAAQSCLLAIALERDSDRGKAEMGLTQEPEGRRLGPLTDNMGLWLTEWLWLGRPPLRILHKWCDDTRLMGMHGRTHHWRVCPPCRSVPYYGRCQMLRLQGRVPCQVFGRYPLAACRRGKLRFPSMGQVQRFS